MEIVKSPGEQRVVLHNVSWETYERLLAEHADSSAPRFAYDRGELEVMSPNPEHERTNRRIAQLVLAVADEMGITAEDLGSTTFRREDLERGFEPDSCFYMRNEEAIRGKGRIDLTVDPPPDPVIEVDITSPSLDKLSIYARMGVPEVWRYDGRKVSILILGGEGTPKPRGVPPCGRPRARSSPVSSRRARRSNAGPGCVRCASGRESGSAESLLS